MVFVNNNQDLLSFSILPPFDSYTIHDEDLTKKIAKTVLEGLSKEQKKHNKKDIMIRIAGVVSLVVIAILGTFFVNPDDILLGEIIDMIKSFQ